MNSQTRYQKVKTVIFSGHIVISKHMFGWRVEMDWVGLDPDFIVFDWELSWVWVGPHTECTP